MTKLKLSAAAAALALAGCVSVPSGPSNMALPGTGKPFDVFRADDYSCRQYASDALGGKTPAQAQQESGVASAVVGAALGAVVGAAAGGGSGAAIGAGAGGAFGGLAGLGAGETSAYGVQNRYDQAYTQCMYGKGHRVAVNGRFAPSYARPAAPAYYPPPAPSYVAPPAPPGPSTGAAIPPPPPPGSPPPNPAWLR